MRTFIACFLLVLAGGANAADAPVFVMGIGLKESCGRFVAAMETNGINAHVEMQRDGVKFVSEKEQVLEFVFGFLTGVNYYRGNRQIELDNASIELWLKNYCTKNPTDHLTDALGYLVIAQDNKK